MNPLNRFNTAPTAARYAACLTLAAVLLSLAAGCGFFAGPDELNPTPQHGIPNDPYPASFIWQEYQSETTRKFANDKYNKQWIWVNVDGVRKVDNRPAGIDVVTPQSLILRTPGSIGQMEFTFRFLNDTDHDDIAKGERPTILCQGGGTDLFGSKLLFNHCRRQDQVEDKSKKGDNPFSTTEG